MDFAGYLQKGILILQLDADTIRDVYRDEDALVPAVVFFAIGGMAIGVGQLSVRWVIFGVLSATLVSFVMVGLLHVFVRLFGGTASFLELYRPIGAAATVHWVQVIPFIGAFLGYLAMLYSLVVTVRVTETAGGLPRSKALLVVTLLFGLCLFLCLVFLAVLSSLMLFRAVFS